MNLFYRETGRGEPVVLLHGLYGSSDNWMTIARKIAENYRVIAVDLRNHGNSSHAASNTYADMVADLAWLFHELELRTAHIMGHSMGGKVAMAFAADYPEKVKSLTVADIAPKDYLNLTKGVSQYQQHETILNALLSVDLLNLDSRKAVEAEISKTIDDPFVISFIMKNLRKGHAGFEWKINVEVLKKFLPEIIGGVDYDFFEERLPILTYPVLFIRGELSDYIQDEDLQRIKRIYPEAKFEINNGTTHYLHSERPDEFIECYIKFIKRC
jgi:esterase